MTKGRLRIQQIYKVRETQSRERERERAKESVERGRVVIFS